MEVSFKVELDRTAFDAGGDKLLDGVETDGAKRQRRDDGGGDIAEREDLDQAQHLDVLAPPPRPHAALQKPAQCRELLRQAPVLKRRRLIESVSLALQKLERVQRIEDQIGLGAGARIAGDNVGAADDDDFVDEPLRKDLAMAMSQLGTE